MARPVICNYLKTVSHYKPFDKRFIESVFSVTLFNFLSLYLTELFVLLNEMFALMLQTQYTTTFFMGKSVLWYNFHSWSKELARFNFLFVCSEVILFKSLNLKYIIFVCFPSVCKYLLFTYVSGTLGGDFLSAQLNYRGKVELYHPLNEFRGIESELSSCLWDKTAKFDDAKISRYTVFKVYGHLLIIHFVLVFKKWLSGVMLCIKLDKRLHMWWFPFSGCKL